MARLIKTNGEEIEISPKNGTDFSLEELHNYVDGYIEIVNLRSENNIMIVNEKGAINGMPVNLKASMIYSKAFNVNQCIYGDVVICKSNMVK